MAGVGTGINIRIQDFGAPLDAQAETSGLFPEFPPKSSDTSRDEDSKPIPMFFPIPQLQGENDAQDFISLQSQRLARLFLGFFPAFIF